MPYRRKRYRLSVTNAWHRAAVGDDLIMQESGQKGESLDSSPRARQPSAISVIA